MEIGLRTGGRGLALVAASAVGIIAAGLLLLTLISLRHQWALVEGHMLMAAKVVLRSTQLELLRVGRHGMLGGRMGHHGGRMAMPPLPGPDQASDLLADITAGGDVLFFGIYGPDGAALVSSRNLPALSPQALTAVRVSGEWHDIRREGPAQILLLAMPALPAVAQACPGGEDCMMPGAEGSSDGLPAPRVGDRSAGRFQGPVVLLGLDVGEHLARYAEFRNAALLQACFTATAAALIMALLFRVVRRQQESRAFLALRRVHARLLDDMPDGLLTLGSDGSILSANPAALTMLGRPAGNLLGLRFSDLAGSPGGLQTTADGWAELTWEGRELELLHRPVPGDVAAGPSSEPAEGVDAPAALVLVRDRTQRKQLERRLAEAEQLAALGRLAAGVAHEIRNPLSALRGFAQFFARRFQGQAPESDYATTMVREADRLNRVVGDMLFLARPQVLEPRLLTTADVLESARRLLDADTQARGAALRFESQVPTLWADPDALTQMLLNLVLNSLEAGAGEIGVRILAQENGNVVEVTDNGPGFSPEALARGQEPFFTTRHGGTGLGLAIVAKLAQDHGGSLQLANAGQGGAVVRVRLPAGRRGEDL